MKRDFKSQFGLWLRLVRTGRFDGRPLKRDWPGFPGAVKGSIYKEAK